MMNPEPSVIMIEFNELCPSLIEKFILAGYLPNFKRLYEEGEVFITDAEEQGEALNPWVQWVTVYSGLAAHEHNIKTLSQAHQLGTKVVWDILSDAGYRVWICGSMNARYSPPLNGCLLPDPWSTGVKPYPPGEFEAYDNFVRAAVQEHTAQSAEISGSKRDFLAFMVAHGLSVRTLFRTSLQMLSERISNTRWKRAVIMDQFQWDIFRYYYRKERPNFSTFFLNSTAHFQHCYWRHMEPEKFISRPSHWEQKKLQDAILCGYRNMDELLGRFIKLAGARTSLIFCTALSQQPYLDHELTGGRRYYRLRDKKLLISHFGLTEEFSYEPVMANQFYLRFRSAEEASRAELVLRSYHVHDRRVFGDEHTRLFHMTRADCSILVQCRCTVDVPSDAVITSEGSSRTTTFYDVFYNVDTIKSGRHHPDGLLWIRQPDRRHVVHEEKVSIRSIAPTLLRIFDVPIPSHMSGQVLFETPSSR